MKHVNTSGSVKDTVYNWIDNAWHAPLIALDRPVGNVQKKEQGLTNGFEGWWLRPTDEKTRE